jgi:cell volume regulation protein A
LGLPADFLVVLIGRENDFVVPSGGTVLRGGDTLLVLSDQKSYHEVEARFNLGDLPTTA